MKKLIKRYRVFIIVFLAMIILVLVNRPLGTKAFTITGNSILEMLLVIPPIFVLLGLLDIWVPRETMIKYMGEGSGLKGIILSIIIGSAAAGPLYGAFPVAAVFMKKGVKFMNILIFIGAWSTTKIPMFLFEITALGSRFAISRLLIDIPGIIIIALILSKTVSREEVKILYENAKAMD
ncbi:permease [Parasporobacterium paucivorans]|uniref:Predicted permease n=1 Tax=Parasporobacterium paucivorans DSM 15970 TaxID=1122934 RepID=A0A1M6LKB1_9FIRM|nr:permease [Parasporobacterium paucivorans]SHJ71595.1 Predicted permease [Parasporobacterium paucivorans DSM 15970]